MKKLKSVKPPEIGALSPIGAVNSHAKNEILSAVSAVHERILKGETVGVGVVEVGVNGTTLLTEALLAKGVRQSLVYGLDKLKFRIHLLTETNLPLDND